MKKIIKFLIIILIVYIIYSFIFSIVLFAFENPKLKESSEPLLDDLKKIEVKVGIELN